MPLEPTALGFFCCKRLASNSARKPGQSDNTSAVCSVPDIQKYFSGLDGAKPVLETAAELTHCCNASSFPTASPERV
jgi:hypothetical protein